MSKTNVMRVVIPATTAFMQANFADVRDYISADAEDFKMALSSGFPHSFISAAVKISNSGPHTVCGMGHFNAIDLHKALINPARFCQPYLLAQKGIQELLDAYKPIKADIENLSNDIPFQAAIDLIGADKLPDTYKEIIGYEQCAKRVRDAMGCYRR